MNSRSQRGFTIVEVMIAMAVGLVVVAVAAVMFSTNSRTYKITGTIGNMQEAGRFALESLQRDSRMVGFRGCNSSNVLGTAPLNNQIATPTAHSNNLATPLAGFEAVGAGWSPALPAEISNPGAPVPGSAPSAGSDVLLVRVAVGAPVAVTASKAPPVGTAPSQVVTTPGASQPAPTAMMPAPGWPAGAAPALAPGAAGRAALHLKHSKRLAKLLLPHPVQSQSPPTGAP
jgi:type IV pilus assembly protein PilW